MGIRKFICRLLCPSEPVTTASGADINVLKKAWNDYQLARKNVAKGYRIVDVQRSRFWQLGLSTMTFDRHANAARDIQRDILQVLDLKEYDD